MERRPPLFYGWFVVAAAFGVTFVGFGGAYSFSAFFESLQQEFRGLARLGVARIFAGGISLLRLGVRQRAARRPMGLSVDGHLRHALARASAWRSRARPAA